MIADHNWYEDKTPLTRSILQIYGTEVFRNRVSDTYWVDRVYKRVIADNGDDVVIITDARFPNEIDMYPNSVEAYAVRVLRETNIVDNHPSETSLDSYTGFNYEIENSGTLDDLREAAKSTVNDILGEKNEQESD